MKLKRKRNTRNIFGGIPIDGKRVTVKEKVEDKVEDKKSNKKFVDIDDIL